MSQEIVLSRNYLLKPMLLINNVKPYLNMKSELICSLCNNYTCHIYDISLPTHFHTICADCYEKNVKYDSISNTYHMLLDFYTYNIPEIIKHNYIKCNCIYQDCIKCATNIVKVTNINNMYYCEKHATEMIINNINIFNIIPRDDTVITDIHRSLDNNICHLCRNKNIFEFMVIKLLYKYNDNCNVDLELILCEMCTLHAINSSRREHKKYPKINLLYSLIPINNKSILFNSHRCIYSNCNKNADCQLYVSTDTYTREFCYEHLTNILSYMREFYEITPS